MKIEMLSPFLASISLWTLAHHNAATSGRETLLGFLKKNSDQVQ